MAYLRIIGPSKLLEQEIGLGLYETGYSVWIGPTYQDHGCPLFVELPAEKIPQLRSQLSRYSKHYALKTRIITANPEHAHFNPYGLYWIYSAPRHAMEPFKLRVKPSSKLSGTVSMSLLCIQDNPQFTILQSLFASGLRPKIYLTSGTPLLYLAANAALQRALSRRVVYRIAKGLPPETPVERVSLRNYRTPSPWRIHILNTLNPDEELTYTLGAKRHNDTLAEGVILAEVPGVILWRRQTREEQRRLEALAEERWAFQANIAQDAQPRDPGDADGVQWSEAADPTTHPHRAQIAGAAPGSPPAA